MGSVEYLFRPQDFSECRRKRYSWVEYVNIRHAVGHGGSEVGPLETKSSLFTSKPRLEALSPSFL